MNLAKLFSREPHQANDSAAQLLSYFLATKSAATARSYKAIIAELQSFLEARGRSITDIRERIVLKKDGYKIRVVFFS